MVGTLQRATALSQLQDVDHLAEWDGCFDLCDQVVIGPCAV
jgi:hypothetical protein